VRADHTIFLRPLNAGVTFDKTDPWELAADPRGMWTVQTGAMGKQNDYGVVSDGYGFEDSPDCERISGGKNSKGPYAVAIGRQANMLQWGFYCAPDRMTDSGKSAFLNAIVYMKQFDGHRPLTKKKGRSREWYQQYVAMVRGLDGKYKRYGASFRDYVKKQFPPAVIEKHGLDADALESWRLANVEYMVGADRWKFEIDADLKKLELSNRKPEFLDWLVERLKKDPKDPLAAKLAARYLGKQPHEVIPFLKANRTWLFFTDTGGFRWLVDENAKARESATAHGR